MRNTAGKPKAKYSSIPVASCLTCLSTYLKEQQTYPSEWGQHDQVEELTTSYSSQGNNHSAAHGSLLQDCEVSWLCLWRWWKGWRHKGVGKGLKLHPEDIMVQNSRWITGSSSQRKLVRLSAGWWLEMTDPLLLTFSLPERSQEMLWLAIKQPEDCVQAKSLSSFLCIHGINQRGMGKKVAVRYIICIVKEETSLKQFQISKFSLGWNFSLKFGKKRKIKNKLLGTL